MSDRTIVARPRPSKNPGVATVGDRLRRRRPTVTLRLVYLDPLMLTTAAAASVLSSPAMGFEELGLARVTTFSIAVFILLALGGAYRRRITINFSNDLRIILGATAVAALSVTFVDVLFTAKPEAASQAVRQWLFAAVYLAAGRAGFQFVETRLRKQGGGEPTLLVGAGTIGNLIASRLTERPESGLRPVAFLDQDPLEVEHALDICLRNPGARSHPARLIRRPGSR